MPSLPMNAEKARWVGSGIPAAMRGVTFGEIFLLGGHPDQLQTARDWVETLPEQQRLDPGSHIPMDRFNFGRGLFLTGHAGCGKTTLAMATACEVRLRYRKSIYYTRYGLHLDNVRTTMREDSRSDPEALSRAFTAVESATNNHLLVLDDVGREHRTDSKFAEDTLFELVQFRHEKGNPTIVIAAGGAAQFTERYTRQFAEFLRRTSVGIRYPKPEKESA